MFTTELAGLRTVHIHPCGVLGTFTSFGPVLAQFIVIRTDICKRSNTDSSRRMLNSCEGLMSAGAANISLCNFTSEYLMLKSHI
jgi:hypothetical protein